MTEQKLLPIDHCRHLAFAAIGGFFGGYALLCRGGILGSSQTMNLLELVSDALFGRGSSVLLHLLCLVIYVVGVMFSVIVPTCSMWICGGCPRASRRLRPSPWAFSRRI